MTLYKGNMLIDTINRRGGGVLQIYKGATLVYTRKFDPVTFTENGTWVVPAGIRKIAVDCVAASGKPSVSAAGKGGRVRCVLSVTPGQVLHLVVGKVGAAYNASDVRTDPEDLNSRLIVAGAGGDGTAGVAVSAGADGGDLVGASAASAYFAGGTGGNQTSGGSVNGTFGFGGAALGGHGGAGWYGGGAGQAGLINKVGTCAAGGGGGSSYTDPELCANVEHTQGFNTGNGYITISMA